MSEVPRNIRETFVVSAEKHNRDSASNFLKVNRLFTEGATTIDEVFANTKWLVSNAEIKDYITGEVIFSQKNVEHPDYMLPNHVNICAHHYLRGSGGKRERSFKEAFNRVASTITGFGYRDATDTLNAIPQPMRTEDGTYDFGYLLKKNTFASKEDAESFYLELLYILCTGKAAFNSPVWYNVGVDEVPQCSACFILSLEDSMDSIRSWISQESRIFQGGSGSGLNISNLRASMEHISNSVNTSSGPIEFMRWADAGAGAIRSGGRTRRAAKMVIMDGDHPDILEFIQCKKFAEDMGRALKASGYDATITGDIIKNLPFQNANNSVRLTDEFMRAVEEDGWWALLARTDSWDRSKFFESWKTLDGEGDLVPYKDRESCEAFSNPQTRPRVTALLRAKHIWQVICQCAWDCGDPGLQFHDTINRYHTTPSHGAIRGSNPCSEYMQLDDTACNLASVNVLAFLKFTGSGVPTFDVEGYEHTVRIMTLAQELVVDMSSYPSAAIDERTKATRSLGQGLLNLGAFLMQLGIPYDSHLGRDVAGVLSACQSGVAYATSAKIAAVHGPFMYFDADSVSKVLGLHLGSCMELATKISIGRKNYSSYENLAFESVSRYLVDLISSAAVSFKEAHTSCCDGYGIGNAQVTVMAPTGTIQYLMGAETSGVEPAISIKSRKSLVGGGSMEILITSAEVAKRSVRRNLDKLPNMVYDAKDAAAAKASEFMSESKYERTLAWVLQCALKSDYPPVSPEGHVEMLASLQKFVSGAISKTVNCPAEWTPEDISRIYMNAWKSGVKAIAVYRDGSKGAQPLKAVIENTEETTKEQLESDEYIEYVPIRKVIDTETSNVTKLKLSIGNEFSTHLFVVRDNEDRVLEVYFTGGKDGSTLAGMLNGLARVMSVALQYGTPINDLLSTLAFTRFEPSGLTNHKVIRFAKSPLDLIARAIACLEQERLQGGDWSEEGEQNGTEERHNSVLKSENAFSAGICHSCGGSNLKRAGSCMSCSDCGETTGCG